MMPATCFDGVFINPATGRPITQQDDALVDESGGVIAPIVDGIPRFVTSEDDYAKGFGYQWNQWTTLSDQLNDASGKYEEIISRTQFDKYETAGKRLLECGMGGGDDTEVLLKMDFSEVHSFDLSTGIHRAAAQIQDSRLTISQASIFDIPYADESFDFVFCHRVLQHTPDPQLALRSICKKVKPGGVLFAHCYRKSWRHMNCFKYKIRWFTTRIPHKYIYKYVTTCGPYLYYLNRFFSLFGPLGRRFIHAWVPYYYFRKYSDLNQKRLRELEQLNTFDALTPAYDLPMTSKEFLRIIREEGFEVQNFYEAKVSPIFCTATKQTTS